MSEKNRKINSESCICEPKVLSGFWVHRTSAESQVDVALILCGFGAEGTKMHN